MFVHNIRERKKRHTVIETVPPMTFRRSRLIDPSTGLFYVHKYIVIYGDMDSMSSELYTHFLLPYAETLPEGQNCHW